MNNLNSPNDSIMKTIKAPVSGKVFCWQVGLIDQFLPAEASDEIYLWHHHDDLFDLSYTTDV